MQANLLITLACYLYILLVILVTRYLKRDVLSPKNSRKFLHAFTGNLPFIMPFFTQNIFPFFVACTFVLITFLVTPHSPINRLRQKLNWLSDITEEGHHTGLVLYAISYSVLAYFFGTQPYIVAAGIFPMAYGDSTAAFIGMRYGWRKIGSKSLEGCVGMFLGSLFSMMIGMAYFSSLYMFRFIDQLVPIFLVSIVVTLIEFISPSGLDNLTVPILGAITFILTGGAA